MDNQDRALITATFFAVAFALYSIFVLSVNCSLKQDRDLYKNRFETLAQHLRVSGHMDLELRDVLLEDVK